MARKKRYKDAGEARHRKQPSNIVEDVTSWMKSSEVDRVADYARHGRCYEKFSDEHLAEAWKTAQCAMADDPWSEEVSRVEQDLSSEFILRNKEPPFAEVMDAMGMLIRKVNEQAARLKMDPQAWHQSGKELARDIEIYKAKRDSSKQ